METAEDLLQSIYVHLLFVYQIPAAIFFNTFMQDVPFY